jgi:hypothetical protein
MLKNWQALLLAIVGVGFLIAAVCAGISTRDFIRTSARADGVVTRLNHGGSHPEIEFVTAAGQKISYAQGGLIAGYYSGQKVRVLYRTNSPQLSPCVDTWGALWTWSIFSSVFGVVFTVSGLAKLLGR